MEVISYIKYLRVAPRKLKLVADAIKKESVASALSKLQFSDKSAAGVLLKALKSAIANAKNNHNLKEEDLKIKNLVVEEGMRIKRMDKSHGARFGRGLILKQLSHIKVILTEK